MESNWVKARSTIVWIAALAAAFGAVGWIEQQGGKGVVAPAAQQEAPRPVLAASPDLPAEPAPRALTEREMQWARTAWAYFEKNAHADTCLAPSVEGFTSATLWDMASSLTALLAARDLGLVDAAAFDGRARLALASLARLPLHAGELPNKSYDIRTLAMTDYAGQPAPAGVGWSAIDIARLVVPLHMLALQHPAHAEGVKAVLARWRWARMVSDGQLYGMAVGADGSQQAVQEGRLGYEQYAARAFALLGLDVSRAADWQAHLQLVEVEGVAVPADTRTPAKFGAQDPVLSEPYLLAGLEFGTGPVAGDMAWRVYRAQESRFRKTGVLTAVSEDHVDQAPWFVYNAVRVGGRNWAAVTDKGADAPGLRSVSVKAAFGWHALYRNEYTSKLVDAVAALNDPARGWYAGLYESGARPNKAVSANTNAVVLESLAYVARGPLLRIREGQR
jgi:hypothetical protein